ncbi:MAG: DUF4258 domain-containing protein [Chitinophagaceae bacterium]|nr:MAG: DUF4258 domain-containing protein [Chitinophagaceae bacterium]
MKPRNLIATLFLLLLVFGYFLKKRWHEPAPREALDRHPEKIYYTRHARCRMDCRHISEADIRSILERGVVNLGKSDRRDRPCPTLAVQGETGAGESIRVILAQCPDETRIITCYNLRREYECDCPGDENKKH